MSTTLAMNTIFPANSIDAFEQLYWDEICVMAKRLRQLGADRHELIRLWQSVSRTTDPTAISILVGNAWDAAAVSAGATLA